MRRLNEELLPRRGVRQLLKVLLQGLVDSLAPEEVLCRVDRGHVGLLASVGPPGLDVGREVDQLAEVEVEVGDADDLLGAEFGGQETED